MKNNTSKIIAFFLVFVVTIILTIPQGFKAEDEITEIEAVVKSHIQRTIDLMPDTEWTDATKISAIIPTYNLEQKINGYIVNLITNGRDTGYIQISSQNATMNVISYTFEGVHYTSDIEGKLYYLGNLNFAFQTDDNNYCFVGSDSSLSLEDLQEFVIEKNDALKMPEISPYSTGFTLIPNFSSAITVTTYDFPGYTNHCSPTAGTNLIKYWGICRGMNELVTQSGKTMEDYEIFSRLYSLMGTTDKGTSIENIASAIYKYMTEHLVFPTRAYFESGSLSYTGYQKGINDGEPIFLDLSKYKSVAHAVVGVGYVGTTAIIIDGWSQSPVYIIYSELEIRGHQEIGF